MGDWQGLLISVALAALVPLVLLAASWWYHVRVRSRSSAIMLWSAVAYFILQGPAFATLQLMQPAEGQPLFDLFINLVFAAMVAGVVAGLAFAVALLGVLREAALMRTHQVEGTGSDRSAQPT